jgi:hypothetical protein
MAWLPDPDEAAAAAQAQARAHAEEMAQRALAYGERDKRERATFLQPVIERWQDQVRTAIEDASTKGLRNASVPVEGRSRGGWRPAGAPAQYGGASEELRWAEEFAEEKAAEIRSRPGYDASVVTLRTGSDTGVGLFTVQVSLAW